MSYTLPISAANRRLALEMCKRTGMSQKDFVDMAVCNIAVEWFGLNETVPNIEHLSPDELVSLIKEMPEDTPPAFLAQIDSPEALTADAKQFFAAHGVDVTDAVFIDDNAPDADEQMAKAMREAQKRLDADPSLERVSIAFGGSNL